MPQGREDEGTVHMGAPTMSFLFPISRAMEFADLAPLFGSCSRKIHIPHSENSEMAAL